MAEYEQKDMTGSMFQNDKGDNAARPDMRGTVTINGVKYSLSAWNNVAKSSGKEYISIKVSEFEERQQGQSNGAANQSLDDSIPF